MKDKIILTLASIAFGVLGTQLVQRIKHRHEINKIHSTLDELHEMEETPFDISVFDKK